MEKELEELRNKMEEAQREAEEKSKFYADLEMRIGKNQLELNVIIVDIERIEKEREVVLEEVVRGKATEKDVLTKSQRLEGLRMAAKDKEDLINTSKKTLAGCSVDLERLRQIAQGASHTFWYKVFGIEKAKLKSESDNPLSRAYGAMRLSGVTVDFGTFIIQHFQERFNLTVEETIRELQAEYLKKGGE